MGIINILRYRIRQVPNGYFIKDHTQCLEHCRYTITKNYQETEKAQEAMLKLKIRVYKQ